MKIPFNIKYRPQIESGEYKVETRSGLPARIVCWDRNSKDMEILALVYDEHIDEDNEELAEVALNGRMFPRGKDHNYDLFIVTPEPELTEFESNVRTCITENLTTHIKDRNGTEMSSTVFIDDDTTKKLASELLSLTYEQFIKDGYVIEKKAFHDAVEKVSPEVMKDVSDNIDKTEVGMTEFEKAVGLAFVDAQLIPRDKDGIVNIHDIDEFIKKKAAELFTLAKKELQSEIDAEIEKAYKTQDNVVFQKGLVHGVANTLKDLPRWKQIKNCDTIVRKPHIGTNMIGEKMLYIGNNCISISKIMKLPGFNS